MMQISRRHMPLLIALAALSACGQQVPGGQLTTPTLDDIKGWVQVASQELPGFLQELITAGLLTGNNQVKALAALDDFQKAATTLLQMQSGTDPTTILNDVAAAATTIMTFIPAAAPFIPLVAGLQLLIAAFINHQQVKTTQPPAPAAIAQMHAQTRSMRR